MRVIAAVLRCCLGLTRFCCSPCCVVNSADYAVDSTLRLIAGRNELEGVF